MGCSYKIEAIGIAAAVINSLSLIPLVVHVIRTKSAYDLHYFWIFATIIASILWFIYGVVNRSYSNIISSILITSLMFTILALKIRYKNK